jgi:hypothetical protein
MTAYGALSVEAGSPSSSARQGPLPIPIHGTGPCTRGKALMENPMTAPTSPDIERHLEPAERVQHQAEAGEAMLVLTDFRLLLVNDDGIRLSTSFDGLRRIQFDLERDRPATLVIVPHSRLEAPQVIEVELEAFDAIARALMLLGLAISGITGSE